MREITKNLILSGFLSSIFFTLFGYSLLKIKKKIKLYKDFINSIE